MGTFGGHALPGSFFIIFALWWTWQAFRRYHRSKEKGLIFKSSVTFPADCLPLVRCRNLQWEGIFKVLFSSIGLLGEIITGYKDGHFEHLGNGQHATMFFCFGLSGAVDILLHHGAPLPENSDYVASMLAFIVEDVLFMFHLHGRKQLDIVIHTLLLYVIHACVIITAIELRFKKSMIVTVARCFLVLLQGTWFWQAGIILYKPLTPWHEEDHKEIMLVTIMFTWHIAVDFIIIMCVGLLAKIVSPFCSRSVTHLNDGNHPEVGYEKVGKNNSLKKTSTLTTDSESEVEFVATRP